MAIASVQRRASIVRSDLPPARIPVTGYAVCSIACWYYMPVDVSVEIFIATSGGMWGDTNDDLWQLTIGNTGMYPRFSARIARGIDTYVANNLVSAGKWNHVAIVGFGTGNHSCYSNYDTAWTGNSARFNWRSKQPFSFNWLCGRRHQSLNQSYVNTLFLGSFACWNSSLTAAEADALTGGEDPRRVRPGHLVGFWTGMSELPIAHVRDGSVKWWKNSEAHASAVPPLPIRLQGDPVARHPSLRVQRT